MTPELTTDRLKLRGWRKSDFPAYADFRADAERNRYSIGGASDEHTAWNALAAICGEWVLSGYGTFAVSQKTDDRVIGYAGIWFPKDIQEPELTWGLFAGHEGKGFATEAAMAAKEWAYRTFGWPPLMSFIHPDNTPSIALAKRMGAVLESEGSLRGAHRLIFRHT
ncbi:MAG: GNAT family N-acetyltransferase [Rhizobiaceae bacterium]|jgi:RimJ/RimL family protein N-acetyltransferase|nr:GNAT family N-acetyltransferase [Rhizobiaceae bacterium]